MKFFLPKMALPTKGIKKTKLGFSTDSSVLEKLELIHPIAGLLLNFRMIHKLKSTYTDALAKTVSPSTDRVHTRFNQTGTGTGRLSSSRSKSSKHSNSVSGRKAYSGGVHRGPGLYARICGLFPSRITAFGPLKR